MNQLIKIVKDFLAGIDLPGLAQYAEVILLFLVGSGVVVFRLLWKLGKTTLQFYRQRKLSKDLHPFFTPVEIKTATQYYVPTKCQNIAPSKEWEPGYTHDIAAKEKLIPFFLKKGFKYEADEQRFYIILADSGIGKTTFMINLYLSYVSQWFGKTFAIKLMPLGFPEVDEELDKMDDKEKENTILLLDAFDEDRQAVADYKKRSDDIINKIFRFRKVIITCRTQFFPSEKEEPEETGILKFGGQKGYHVFCKMYISPFDEKDIKKYLNKKFPIFNFGKRLKARQIVKGSPNLMVRPMLLSYIDDLLKSNRKYEFTHQVYKELIDRWIERESRRYKEDKRKNFKEELYKFSKAIALDIYRKREFRSGLIIYNVEIKPFAEEHGIQLDEMEMKSRSLLNRNVRGEYKFSHKSILEYFLALEIVNNYSFAREFSFEGMDQAKSFYNSIWKECTYKFLTQRDLNGRYGIRGATELRGISKLKLNELESLEYLYLDNNGLTDISLLKELKELKELHLSKNHLTDISPLKELKQLRYLDLSNNQLTDISPLRELRKLEELNLFHNRLTDISPLRELKGLGILNLKFNKLTDISPLKELKRLEALHLGFNPIPGEQIEEIKGQLITLPKPPLRG